MKGAAFRKGAWYGRIEPVLAETCLCICRSERTYPGFWDDMPLQEAGLYESTWNEKVGAQEADAKWNKGRPILDSLLPSFPRNCIYMRWNYGMATQPGNIHALNWYKEHNLEAMIATATNAEGGMLFQPDIRNQGFASAGNSCIKSFIELAAERKVTGHALYGMGR